MTSNRDRADRVAQVLNAVVDGDADAIERLVTDDVQVWGPEVTASSRADLTALLGRRDDAFSNVALDVVALDVGGEFGCAEWTVEMTHSGTIELSDGTAVEATGRALILHGVTVAEFTGDRICSLRQYWDRFGLLEQLELST